MADPIAFRQFFRLSVCENRQLGCHQILKITTEVLQKQIVILAGQQLEDLIIISLQMPEQMQKHRLAGSAIKNMVMVRTFFQSIIKNMAEKLLAQSLEQIVLGFKMGIEGGSTYIGPLDNLPYRDLPKILLGQQFNKGAKNSISGFSLPSVHRFLRTFLRNCSVSYNTAQLHIVFFPHRLHNSIQTVYYRTNCTVIYFVRQ